MNKTKLILLLLLLFLLIFPFPAYAGTEPLQNDSITTALFFGDIEKAPPVDRTPPREWEIGDEKEFNVLNVETGAYEQCTARVILITDNIVFWIDQDNITDIPDSVSLRLREFGSETLPMLRGVFGEETSPGIDNDPRIHVVFSEKIGDSYNGYFSAEDSADPRLRPNSNGMDLLLLNTKLIQQGADAVADTLTHEYQHLIHFSYDPNETSFINEGFSGLAEYLAIGPIRDTFIRNYLNDTGRSLIRWPENGNKGAYYGSSFLFSVYLYDRFGPELIRHIVQSPENGLNGLDQALKACGSPFSADDIFLQWGSVLLGNLMKIPVRDWDYQRYVFPQNGIIRDIQQLSCGISEMHEVSQYGLRFYQTDCPMPSVISVTGIAESPVTDLPIPGGRFAWWGGAVSNSLAFLRRTVDLGPAAGREVIFEYDTAFNIEEGYDHYYLLLEDESGKIRRLTPSTASDEDPAGTNMGSGTTGNSDGIRHESIDLSPWAGQRIRLTFVYLTDTAGVGDGLLLDNFRIDAVGFHDDAEGSDNGWETAGFSRIPASVPQQYALILLRSAPYGNSTAEFHPFTGGETAEFDCPEGRCAFAVTAISHQIRSRAAFTVGSSPVPVP